MGVMLANVERLALEAMASALSPPQAIDYLAWAEQNITIGEGNFQGPFNRRLFPYLDEILRALGPEDPCRFVTFMASAQSSKTTVGTIFATGSMAMSRGTFMVVHPTDDNARRWSKVKLAQMIRSTPAVRDLFPQRSRDIADSVLFKERKDGEFVLLISGANSPASLSQVTAHFLLEDDLSKYEMNAAGDPEAQADNRSRAIEFAKILKCGTPLVLPGCRITRNFEQGSQEYPYVRCPHCSHPQVLTWDNMLAALDETQPEGAHFTCESCEEPIREHHRPKLLETFEWRARNPAAKRYHRSFWVWSAYSYLQSWERIAREWLKYRGDPAGEQTFMNDVAGLAYKGAGAARPWEELRDRAALSPYARGSIPPGALALSLGIDCQQDRVEWHLVGHGREYRRFVIEYGVIGGHISSVDCQRNLDLLIKRKWKNSAGVELEIDMVAIDGNAWTENVYSWVRSHPSHKVLMVRGDPRDAAPRLSRVKRERNEKTGELLKYSRRFFNMGVSSLKMSLYMDLAKDDPEARGFVAFPRGLEDEYFRQLVSERREPLNKYGFTTYRWVKDARQANEALDTMIQATAAAIVFGTYRFSDVTWDRLQAEREPVPTATSPVVTKAVMAARLASRLAQ